jgi:hypothetical protein
MEQSPNQQHKQFHRLFLTSQQNQPNYTNPQSYQQPSQQSQSNYTNPQSYQQSPASHPQSSLLQQQSPPQDSSRPWWISLIVLAVILVPYFWGRSGFHFPSTSTPISSQSVQQDQPTVIPGWTIAQTFTGTGAQKTEIFTVPRDYKIVWACYGIFGGSDGLLYVNVMDANNSFVDSSAVNANCPGGTITTGSTEEHQRGKIYLAMQAAGDWTVEVQLPQ